MQTTHIPKTFSSLFFSLDNVPPLFSPRSCQEFPLQQLFSIFSDVFSLCCISRSHGEMVCTHDQGWKFTFFQASSLLLYSFPTEEP